MGNKIEFKITDGLNTYDITLIQWQDEWNHWRLGINWVDEDNYLYIVEQPTVQECLTKALEFIKELK